MISLNVLDLRIHERSTRTEADHPWWPCTRGCDHCCRSLPGLPTVTKAEWDRLAPALSQELEDKLRAPVSKAPVVCPLLGDDGACTVYDVRPIQCRTYGFYTERDALMVCSKVVEAVASHDAQVVWGNGEAIASDLREHGEVRSLADWLRDAD